MKIALAMICKGDNDEAQLLRRCLKDLSPYVDGIFITSTYRKGEAPNETVKQVAEEFHAKHTAFEWCDDFSAARNFSFSQVPKDFDYIMWSDADDRWRGLDKLRPTLEANRQADAFGFWYLYDWDEFKKPVVVHRKTMLIRNDGAAKWVGALHEDLEPTRQLEVNLVEGIERLHMTNAARYATASKRNVAIAIKDQANNPDDPRSYWNLGNSQIGVADHEGARDTFEKFLSISGSDAEKYIAHQRLSDVYKSLGDRDKAIQQLQQAIGLQPMLPDAYLQLAFAYYSFGDMEKAEQYCLQGLVKRPQIHKMINFNPRDYDYNPLMLLAKIYYQRNRPDLMLPILKGCLKIYPTDKELKRMVSDGEQEVKSLEKALKKVVLLQKIKSKTKLKKALDELPDEIKSHPMVAVLRNTNFIKTESSGRDLVFYCGQTMAAWNPELFKTKGFGGSEEAVINIARELSKLGWNVTVYNNCGYKEMKELVSVDYKGAKPGKIGTKAEPRYVTYKPFWEFNYRDKQDVVILWRWTKPLDAEINAPKVFVDLHDVVPEGEFTEKRLQRVTKIFVKTNFHRSLFPNVPDNKFVVIPNGMDMSLFTGKEKRDPMLIINTSSPDRSMDVLPKLFKQVKKQVPEARLQWAYGWDVFDSSNGSDAKMMAWKEKILNEMKEAGVEVLGRLPQSEVAKLYERASILAYPTEFAEIDCISVKKAQAAGCLPVATDFGALAESIRFGVKIHSTKTKDNWNKPYQFHFGLEDTKAQAKWVEAAVAALRGRHHMDEKAIKAWRSQYEWNLIALRWHDCIGTR